MFNPAIFSPPAVEHPIMIADEKTPPKLIDKPHTAIDQAFLRADGTIVMNLESRYEDGGSVMETQTCSRGDPCYEKTLQHLGGLKPGETKVVYNDWN